MTKTRFASAFLALGLGALLASSANAQFRPMPGFGSTNISGGPSQPGSTNIAGGPSAPPSTYSYPLNGRFVNPSTLRRNIIVAPGAFAQANSFRPCGQGSVAAMTGCVGPQGTQITVQRLRPTSTPFWRLRFHVPGRFQFFYTLTGGPNQYSFAAPPHVCIAGGGTWIVDLLTADGANHGTIGSFTSTGCPR